VIINPENPPAQPAGGKTLLEVRGLSKRYPGVDALSNVDFDLRAGEVHILFGENGAGKSTLISIISGAQQPTSGTIWLNGEEAQLASVHDGRVQGINAVYQEFSLVPHLTVAENIFLGHEPVRLGLLDAARTLKQASQILERLGFPVPPGEKVAYLSRAEQQMVEIAKAFRSAPRILILDEPTASLTEREAERLFTLIDAARRDGVGIIYITHRMAEIGKIGNRVTILRDGKKVTTIPVNEADDDRLVQLMTGRVISQIFPHIYHKPTELRLKVQNLSTTRRTVRSVNIEVYSGEVVGIAGLVGSGKSDVGRACFGLEKIGSGEVWIDGVRTTKMSSREVLDRGVYYLPSDRRQEGLVLNRCARENISLADLRESSLSSYGFLQLAEERRRALKLGKQVELRPLHLEKSAEQFSGGNQQKIMVAKALARNAGVVIFDEPTVGVDVGTRVAIYGLIRDLCESGCAILLISSDLPEILHLTHRAYVMYRGELRTELRSGDITQENVLSHFFERRSA